MKNKIIAPEPSLVPYVKPRAIVEVDYRPLKDKLLGGILTDQGKQYQYSVEQRSSFLQIVELNFKPHTSTQMAIPVAAYNLFVQKLNSVLPKEGAPANKLMPTFIWCMDQFRRLYLGDEEPLKPSSYMRYSSVLYLLWKITDGSLGFKAELKEKKVTKTIEQDKDKLIIEIHSPQRGYWIKPTGKLVLNIVDKEQSNLLSWAGPEGRL